MAGIGASVDVVRDMLLLAEVDIPEEVIGGWTPGQRDEAQVWAAKTHLAASDNPVKAPPRPAFINEAQRGVSSEGPVEIRSEKGTQVIRVSRFAAGVTVAVTGRGERRSISVFGECVERLARALMRIGPAGGTKEGRERECWYCGRFGVTRWLAGKVEKREVLMCEQHATTTRTALFLRSVGRGDLADALDEAIGVETRPGFCEWESVSSPSPGPSLEGGE